MILVLGLAALSAGKDLLSGIFVIMFVWFEARVDVNKAPCLGCLEWFFVTSLAFKRLLKVCLVSRAIGAGLPDLQHCSHAADRTFNAEPLRVSEGVIMAQ